MAENSYLIGIDVGTTGSKALLVGIDGTVAAEATTEYALATPQPRWAEQDPHDWWWATRRSIRQVLTAANATADQILALGLSGQMHGLVLLDEAGEVLRPAILWNDQRTGAECVALTAAVGPQRVLELTGNPILPGFTAPKLRWVQSHEPDVFARVRRVLLPKDYVRSCLTGAFATDVSDASGTALFDVRRRKWSPDMCAAAGVAEAWLPDALESPDVSGILTQAAAEETGLRRGTPVVAGAGDQAAQAVGVGAVDEGLLAVALGTSGVVFGATRSYQPEPAGRLHCFCHAVPERWHHMGVMLSAAGSFRWYRDVLCRAETARAEAAGRDVYDVLTEAAAEAPPGCDGLIFLPYLTGERTPHADPLARGAFVGLTLRHGKPHLTRAVLEGVCFGLRDSLELMRELAVDVRRVRVSGGGARSAFWRQLLADVLNCTLETVAVTQGAAYGAALLAGVGAGCFESVEAASREVVQVTETHAPGPAATSYDAVHTRYQALYPALRAELHALNELG